MATTPRPQPLVVLEEEVEEVLGVLVQVLVVEGVRSRSRAPLAAATARSSSIANARDSSR